METTCGRLADGQDGTEGVVPNLAGDAEAEIGVLEVMGHVVDLHLLDILRQLCVVQGVVRAVVEHVEGERARDDSVGVGDGEEEVGQPGEWMGEGGEEDGGHD